MCELEFSPLRRVSTWWFLCIHNENVATSVCSLIFFLLVLIRLSVAFFEDQPCKKISDCFCLGVYYQCSRCHCLNSVNITACFVIYFAFPQNDFSGLIWKIFTRIFRLVITIQLLCVLQHSLIQLHDSIQVPNSFYTFSTSSMAWLLQSPWSFHCFGTMWKATSLNPLAYLGYAKFWIFI